MMTCLQNLRMAFASLLLASGSLSAFAALDGRSSPSEERVAAERAEPVFHRAMWVWRTQTFREDPALWDELIAFSKRRGVDELFLQLNMEISPGSDGRVRAEMLTPDRVRDMLREATAAGIRVHALHGDPQFAMEDQHDRALAIVESVVRYNRASAPDERFAAVRMDVEPYTSDEWRHGDKASVMLGWLEMNRKILEYLRAYAPELPYGIDIPFWLDRVEEDGSLRHGAEYRGVYQPLSHHFIDMVDNVGIMSYRVRATGPNSVVGVSKGDLEYASRTGGARVYLGVNTRRPDGDNVPPISTFGGRTIEEMEQALDAILDAAARYPAFTGVAIHHYHTYRDLVEE